MTSDVIAIAEVVPQAATRGRGKEAFAQILQRIEALQDARPLRLTMDFRDVSVLTASFLDELVLRSAEVPADTTLVFWLDSDEKLDTLREVCAAREARCYYRVGDDDTVRYTRRRGVPSIKVRKGDGSFFEMLGA